MGLRKKMINKCNDAGPLQTNSVLHSSKQEKANIA